MSGGNICNVCLQVSTTQRSFPIIIGHGAWHTVITDYLVNELAYVTIKGKLHLVLLEVLSSTWPQSKLHVLYYGQGFLHWSTLSQVSGWHRSLPALRGFLQGTDYTASGIHSSLGFLYKLMPMIQHQLKTTTHVCACVQMSIPTSAQQICLCPPGEEARGWVRWSIAGVNSGAEDVLFLKCLDPLIFLPLMSEISFSRQ